MHMKWLLQHEALGPTGKTLLWGGDGCWVQEWVLGLGARAAPVLTLPWAVRMPQAH